jgi:hypothetical protein
MKRKRLVGLLIASALAWTTALAAESVVVGNAGQLAAAIVKANRGGAKTIILKDGTYTLQNMLWVEARGVTVRSASGNRDAVIIEGKGMKGSVTHIFNVAGSKFTVRDVTLRRVSQHAIQIHGELHAHSPWIKNVRIADTGQQMVKGSYNAGKPQARADNGMVEDCLFEYSADKGPQYYIGGIDVHNARNWVVRKNTFKGIQSPRDQVAEFAVHFWSDSQGTLVEGNAIINCDRGIGFGMGDRGHVGGIIRNNMIYHGSSGEFADVGIALESAVNAQVYNNTLFQEHAYPNAIEYRFPGTRGVLIANNLTNRAIRQRDGAAGTVTHNVRGARAGWFISPSSGDLHLRSAIPAVVDKGGNIPGLTTDFDGESRPKGQRIDIGADEY